MTRSWIFKCLLLFQMASTATSWIVRRRVFTPRPRMSTTAAVTSQCGNPTVLSGSTGVISTPNHPQDYGPNSDCSWKITASPGARFIVLQFDHFRLEVGSSCSYDYVEIRNGDSPTSPLLRKLCGNKAKFRVVVNGRSMFIRFRSDGSANYNGFRAVYRVARNEEELCETDWHKVGNSTYKLCDIHTTWVGALKVCQNMGANMVKIETDSENTNIFNLQKYAKFFDMWIGLTRGPYNRFYWFDGTRPGYTSWIPNQPDNWKGEEHCAYMRVSRGRPLWNDVICINTHNAWVEGLPRFVCETEKCQKTPLLSSSSAVLSSSRRDSNHTAKHGLLANTSSIWCPQSNSTIEWLEVDLGAPYFICGVAAVNDITFANRSSVTWYQVSTSLSQFTDDPGNGNSSQEFETSVNEIAVVVHEFRRLARYVRFNPTRSVNWPCMKIEIYGGKKVPPLQMTIPLTNKTVEHANVVELRCIANGHPFPSYSWTKNGSSVIPNGVLSQENTVLRISPVNLEDEGQYTCTATNLLGSVYSSAYLTVHAKPKDLKFQTLVNGMKGSDVVLSCESFALPVPNATWVNENVNLSSWRYSISTALIRGTNRLSTNLTIRNISVYDMGLYKCRFWNYRGATEGSINLDIVDGCSDVVFDFEDGAASLKDWGRTGTAFNNQPTYGDNVRNRNRGQISNHQRDFWIGGYENRPDANSTVSTSGDGPQGTLISPEFVITGANISFLIGGGCDRSTEAVELLIGGLIKFWSTGRCHEMMTRKTWNVQPYVGRKARLRLIDFSSGDWGHINFDDFRGAAIICKGCVQPLGMTSGKIPDFAITASSTRHAAKHGRLHSLNRDGYLGCWSPRRNVIGEWLQVDLGTVVMVTKIATQGKGSFLFHQRVTQYTLEYSENGTDFEQYGNNKVLEGNSRDAAIVEHILSPPIRGRFVRVYPQAWFGRIALRLELYGCPPEKVSPMIFGLPKEIEKLEGSTVSLRCLAKGFPYLDYRWVRRELSNSLTRSVSGPSLVLTNVTENDDGVYTCVASNEVGNDSFDVRLNVHTFPSIVHGMKNKQVSIKGNVTTFVCQGKSNPQPTAAWLKDGQEIKAKVSRVKSSTAGDKLLTSKLVITDTKYEDSGVYTCAFDNTFGATNSSGIVLVYGLPEFTLMPKDVSVIKGENAILPCAATAVPTPQIRWKLRGYYLRDAQVTENGTLVMRKVQNNKLFEGIYTCEASNSIGIKASTAKLEVYERPWFKTPPRRSVNVAQTQGAVLHCDAAGDPQPELEWRKDGMNLKTTERIIFQSNKQILILRQLRREDSGLYQCVARNIVGNVTTTTNLIVFGEPEINKFLTRRQIAIRLGNPANVMCLATNPLPIHYTWTKNGEEIHDSDNVKVHSNILVVTPWQPKDFGIYVCHMSNIAGEANYSIVLVQTTKANASYAAVGARTSYHKSVGLSTAILLPLIVLIIVLVVVIIFIAYRYVQLKRQHACAQGGIIGFVKTGNNKNGGERLLQDDLEINHMYPI